MIDDAEKSPDGSKIYRYTDEDFKETYDDLGSSSIEEIGSHITKYIGEPEWVLHELVSPTVHVDVHVVEPTARQNFITLITSGMSDKPMVKAPLADFQFAELVVALPPDWKVDDAAIHDENYYWPIRALKYLSRFPHEFDTWIWSGHTISNGDPPSPFGENTRMNCILLSSPILFDSDFRTLEISGSKKIHFLSLIPLYPEETNYKLEHGIDALYDRFDKNGISELLNPQRASCCP
jgi:hypothetical protein